MKNMVNVSDVSRRILSMRLGLAVVFIFMAGNYLFAQKSTPDLPNYKQTKLELYVTAVEAYDMWKANPDKVKILDVRTPEEYIFVGHPDMAYNIPLIFQTYDWDAVKQEYKIKPNADFLPEVKALFKPDDIILVTCRSGGRGAMAVNMMAGAGYKNAYNITDGIEGDAIKDKQDKNYGKHKKNGWMNAGLPWTYDLDPKLLKLPKNP